MSYLIRFCLDRLVRGVITADAFSLSPSLLAVASGL